MFFIKPKNYIDKCYITMIQDTKLRLNAYNVITKYNKITKYARTNIAIIILSSTIY